MNRVKTSGRHTWRFGITTHSTILFSVPSFSLNSLWCTLLATVVRKRMADAARWSVLAP